MEDRILYKSSHVQGRFAFDVPDGSTLSDYQLKDGMIVTLQDHLVGWD